MWWWGEGGFKNSPKLRDVSYGRPLRENLVIPSLSRCQIMLAPLLIIVGAMNVLGVKFQAKFVNETTRCWRRQTSNDAKANREWQTEKKWKNKIHFLETIKLLKCYLKPFFLRIHNFKDDLILTNSNKNGTFVFKFSFYGT